MWRPNPALSKRRMVERTSEPTPRDRAPSSRGGRHSADPTREEREDRINTHHQNTTRNEKLTRNRRARTVSSSRLPTRITRLTGRDSRRELANPQTLSGLARARQRQRKEGREARRIRRAVRRSDEATDPAQSFSRTSRQRGGAARCATHGRRRERREGFLERRHPVRARKDDEVFLSAGARHLPIHVAGQTDPLDWPAAGS